MLTLSLLASLLFWLVAPHTLYFPLITGPRGRHIATRTPTPTRRVTPRPTRTPPPTWPTLPSPTSIPPPLHPIYITEFGSEYHRWGCPVLSSPYILASCWLVYLQGFTPCPICHPYCPLPPRPPPPWFPRSAHESTHTPPSPQNVQPAGPE